MDGEKATEALSSATFAAFSFASTDPRSETNTAVRPTTDSGGVVAGVTISLRDGRATKCLQGSSVRRRTIHQRADTESVRPADTVEGVKLHRDLLTAAAPGLLGRAEPFDHKKEPDQAGFAVQPRESALATEKLDVTLAERRLELLHEMGLTQLLDHGFDRGLRPVEYQVVDCDTESVCQRRERGRRRVLQSSGFKLTDGRTVDAREVGKLLLGQAPPSAELLEICRKLVEPSAFSLSHAADGSTPCAFNGLRYGNNQTKARASKSCCHMATSTA